MKKIFKYLFFILIFFILVWVVLYFVYPDYYKTIFNNLSNNLEDTSSISLKVDTSSWKTNTWSNIDNTDTKKEDIEKSDIKGDAIKSKIEILRKRLSLKNLLIKWDTYSTNNQYEEALNKYLDVLKESPEDDKVKEKIAETYFNMKDFSSSYSYYKKMTNYDWVDKNKVVLSLLLSKPIFSEDINYLSGALNSIWLNQEELFYYKNSISCTKDFSLCKQEFQDYFSENQNINFEPLIDIKNSIDNFYNSDIKDLYYKDALIIWSFFKNSLYTLVIPLWKNLLLEKVWYKPIIKMLWKSYYEIWDFDNAKDFLNKYFEIDQDDVWVVYLIWVINMESSNYILSNVFLNKALDKWYEPKIDVLRRLAYNYWELWDEKRLLETLNNLYKQKEDLDKSDMAIIVYYNILNENYDFAKEISLEWLKSDTEDDLFYAYLWLIEKELWDLKESEFFLSKWYEINSKNPMINLYLWQLEKEKWNKIKALLYFKKAVALDSDWEFGLEAKDELDKLN